MAFGRQNHAFADSILRTRRNTTNAYYIFCGILGNNRKNGANLSWMKIILGASGLRETVTQISRKNADFRAAEKERKSFVTMLFNSLRTERIQRKIF